MSDRLREYFFRFSSQLPESPALEAFYTQLTLDNYYLNLPGLPEVDRFCERVWLARETSQTICIYSDYDADAVTATGVMYQGLLNLGISDSNLDFYAPDRFTEGYGMNPEAITQLSRQYDLIISVDCGISSTHEADLIAQQSTCDLLITDHHHLANRIPNCLAAVNPRVTEYFQRHPETEKQRRETWERDLHRQIQNTSLQSTYQQLYPVWQDKLHQNRTYSTPLSTSTTGVGVAWFSLVWLGYFLWEVNNLS